MSGKKKIIMGREFILALIAAEIVPENCTQVIIEAAVNGVAVIHYSTLGDQRLLEIVPAEARAAGVTGRTVRRFIKDPDTGEEFDVTTP